jgi:hypothetical protein
MEKTRIFTPEYFYPGEESMASFSNGDVFDSEALDFLRKSFVRRIVKRYYGVFSSVDSDGPCASVLEDDDIVTARVITYWTGMLRDLES